MLVAGAGVAYALLSVVMTWPIAIRLSSPYADIWQDFGLWLWNLWWMKEALVHLGTSPYFTAHIFYPVGSSLVFHNLSPYNALLGIPLQLLGADVITTHNLLFLSSFVVGGVGMFLLVRELTGEMFAGFFAGATFSFTPLRVLWYPWTNLWATQWLPFAFYFLLRVLRVGRPADGVGLAVALALATLADWHQPAFLLVAGAGVTLSAVLSRRGAEHLRRGLAQRLAWIVSLYGLLVSPLGYVAMKELLEGTTVLRTPSYHAGFGLVGQGFGDIYVSYGVILGWVPIAVTMYGMTRGLDFWTMRFAGVLAGFFILSLGEGLHLPGLEDPVLPLPLVVWRRIPALGIIRGAFYFYLMVQVCFAVLVGYGAGKLWQRWSELSPGKTGWRRPALGAGLLALTLVEAFQGPLPSQYSHSQPVYELVRREGTGKAMLDIPLSFAGTTGTYAGRSMFFQTVHTKPLVTGFTSFDTVARLAFLEDHPVLCPFLERLRRFCRDIPDQAGALRSFVTDYGIEWIVLHRPVPEKACLTPQPTRGALGRLLTFVTPAVLNTQIRTWWRGSFACYYEGLWTAERAHQADTALRPVFGPPFWEDAELVVYRIR
jgi:hypothetical protein